MTAFWSEIKEVKMADETVVFDSMITLLPHI